MARREPSRVSSRIVSVRVAVYSKRRLSGSHVVDAPPTVLTWAISVADPDGYFTIHTEPPSITANFAPSGANCALMNCPLLARDGMGNSRGAPPSSEPRNTLFWRTNAIV